MSLIIDAARFAEDVHRGQFRDDRITPYFNGHVARVAGRAAAHPKATEEFVAAMYLHDTIEDCGVLFQTLVNRFGVKVATIVWDLTSLSKQDEYICKLEGTVYRKPSRATRKNEDAKYLITVPDLTKIGKLIDRNENLWDTYRNASPDWALRYVLETEHLYNVALKDVDMELEAEMKNLLTSIRSKYKLILEDTEGGLPNPNPNRLDLHD